MDRTGADVEVARQSRVATTKALFAEIYDLDVFVARQTFGGNPGIDPGTPLELGVEFVKTVATAPSCALSRARMKRELTRLQA